MDLIVILTTLCISLSIIPRPCASHDQAYDLQFSTPTVPRKIRLIQEASLKNYGEKGYVPYNKQKEVLSGKAKQKMVDNKRGTRQEWVEAEASEFFTMDYSRVRRRRPIHNKSLPGGP